MPNEQERISPVRANNARALRELTAIAESDLPPGDKHLAQELVLANWFEEHQRIMARTLRDAMRPIPNLPDSIRSLAIPVTRPRALVTMARRSFAFPGSGTPRPMILR